MNKCTSLKVETQQDFAYYRLDEVCKIETILENPKYWCKNNEHHFTQTLLVDSSHFSS